MHQLNLVNKGRICIISFILWIWNFVVDELVAELEGLGICENSLRAILFLNFFRYPTNCGCKWSWPRNVRVCGRKLPGYGDQLKCQAVCQRYEFVCYLNVVLTALWNYGWTIKMGLNRDCSVSNHCLISYFVNLICILFDSSLSVLFHILLCLIETLIQAGREQIH